jgi:hypothetical protein
MGGIPVKEIDLSVLGMFKGKGRDPQRIDTLVCELERIWKKHPDTRLGQLLVSCVDGDADKLFYMEDEALLEKLRERFPAAE